MQAQMDAYDEAKGLSMTDIIGFKRTIVELLNQGETVPAGLRRLGGKKLQGAGYVTILEL